MPRIKIILAVLALLISSLACVTLMGEPAANPDSSEQLVVTQIPATDIPTEVPDEIVSCPLITDQIIKANSSTPIQGESETMDFGSRDGDNITNIVTYLVSNNEIIDPSLENVPANLQSEQNDTAAHQKLWKYFANLIPLDYRKNLAEFSVMTDGRDNILAAVTQTNTDPSLWNLEVDIADSQDYYYLTYTFIHEFAHLMTLGPNQVPPSKAVFNNPDNNDIYLKEVAACPNFFPGEGCANSDSYINQYYAKFWISIYDEWNSINLEENDDVYYKRLDKFYYKYQDQFLTDYSVTHPAEDIAEAFSFFVFSEKPAGGTIAEQKILFFYNYPELVNLRTTIISDLCINFPQ